jgi:hypothetical protein
MVLTLKANTSSRVYKPPVSAPVPLTAEQRKTNQAAREGRQSAIDAVVIEWLAETELKAAELAEKFGRPKRHFLDLFFHGGARMINQRPTVSAWNAWQSKVAEEENAGKTYNYFNGSCSPSIHRYEQCPDPGRNSPRTA